MKLYRVLNTLAIGEPREARLWIEFGVPVTIGPTACATFEIVEGDADPMLHVRITQRTVREPRDAWLTADLCQQMPLYEDLVAIPRALSHTPLGRRDRILIDFHRREARRNILY